MKVKTYISKAIILIVIALLFSPLNPFIGSLLKMIEKLFTLQYLKHLKKKIVESIILMILIILLIIKILLLGI